MMEKNERNAFETWLKDRAREYIDTVAREYVVDPERLHEDIVDFVKFLKEKTDQMALYVIACNEDYDGALYGIYKETIERETEELDFLKRVKESGVPILTVHSVLLEQRY